MSFPVIFSSADVDAIVQTRRRDELAKKQTELQNLGCDALFKSIGSGFFSQTAMPKEQILAEFSAGKKEVVVWIGKQVCFRPADLALPVDNRWELVPGSADLTIQQEAFASGCHSAVFPYSDRDPNDVSDGVPSYSEVRGAMSIYAIIRHTDFLDLLAASFGPNFSCSWRMEDDNSDRAQWIATLPQLLPSGYVIKRDMDGNYDRTPAKSYWDPKIHRIYLRFWPRGVPKEIVDRKKAAMEAHLARQ